MRSRAAVRHRQSHGGEMLGPRPTGSPDAMVNRCEVGVTGLEPVTSSELLDQCP